MASVSPSTIARAEQGLGSLALYDRLAQVLSDTPFAIDSELFEKKDGVSGLPVVDANVAGNVALAEARANPGSIRATMQPFGASATGRVEPPPSLRIGFGFETIASFDRAIGLGTVTSDGYWTDRIPARPSPAIAQDARRQPLIDQIRELRDRILDEESPPSVENSIVRPILGPVLDLAILSLEAYNAAQRGWQWLQRRLISAVEWLRSLFATNFGQQLGAAAIVGLVIEFGKAIVGVLIGG